MSAQSGGTAKPLHNPVPTITVKTGSHVFLPFLSSFYGSHSDSSSERPVPTITTVDKHDLATALVTGKPAVNAQTPAEQTLIDTMTELGIGDIGFRMLANEELAAAQGFPLDYQFCGNKKEVTKQIGNSVSPPVARAITEALLG